MSGCIDFMKTIVVIIDILNGQKKFNKKNKKKESLSDEKKQSLDELQWKKCQEGSI